MGTTVVAALVSGDTLTFASVGDSRMYLVNDHAIAQLTEDDSWLSALKAQEPNIDASQLEKHPLRHVITKAIGTLTDTEITIHERPLATATPCCSARTDSTTWCTKPRCSRSWTPTRRSKRGPRP